MSTDPLARRAIAARDLAAARQRLDEAVDAYSAAAQAAIEELRRIDPRVSRTAGRVSASRYANW